ncbi:MAG TPA: phosphodiesterase [Stellaceae bacterium]|nr:phosphodiesterase [Stellaceae bacterium]
MLIAQISDTHILAPGKLFRARIATPAPGADSVYAEIDTGAYLARAVAAINELVPLPDITVVTGDLVDHGEAAEYAHFRQLLAPLRMPVFVIAGNHDARAPLRKAFGADGYLPPDGFLHYTLEDYSLRLVALDTLIPGENGGRLCAERLAWLDATLAAAPNRPTLVLMHHPPFATGITFMDRYGLENIGALAEIVARHPQIERITCGHLHRAIDRRFAGTVAGTAPSTAHQLRLDLRPGARMHFQFEPPGYQLHLWEAESGLVTHTAVLGDWSGPGPLDAAR